jgi:hypothetical protein
MPTRNRKIKGQCVKNKKTRRCVRSFDADETSKLCKFFNRSQRCRSVKADVSFVTFKSFKVKESVRTFLTRKIVDKPLDKIIESAEKTNSYEDTLQFLFEDKHKTATEIKNQFLDELLESSSNYERDYEGSDVITLKSLKKAINQNAGFEFLL